MEKSRGEDNARASECSHLEGCPKLEECLKRHRMQYWWHAVAVIIAVLLVLTLIGSFVVILNDHLLSGFVVKAYISDAATILSILLSVVAIAYTVMSGNQINYQFHHIQEASTIILKESANLEHSTRKFENNVDVIIDKLEELKQHQENIEKHFNNQKANQVVEGVAPGGEKGNEKPTTA